MWVLQLPNEYFSDVLRNKSTLNSLYSTWYFKLHYSDDNILIDKNGSEKYICNTYLSKGLRIKSCMDLSLWDIYYDNKVLDLVKTNRCMDNRFCPNCKKVDVSRFICNFITKYKLLDNDYVPYMLTLTVPNVPGEDLDATISKMNKAFRKLIHYLSKCNEFPFSISGGVKVLEITYNKDMKTYHPHFHCLVLFESHNYNYISNFLDLIYKDSFSIKSDSYNYLSDYGCLIKKIWSMIWNDKRLSQSNLNLYNFSPGDSTYLDITWLQVDLRPLDKKGIYEIFKYTFKDSDIADFDVFKTLYFSLIRRRLRQGFGILYDLKCEDFDEVDVEDLNLSKEEVPEELMISELQELLLKYSDYKKYSRKNSEHFSSFIQ